MYLEPIDLERLAGHFEMTPQEVFRKFAARDEEDHLVIELRDDGDCPFLRDTRCSIYGARPLQCRSYPFVSVEGYSTVESRSAWEHEKTFCPGIDRGRSYSKETIEKILRARAEADGFPPRS